MELPRSWRILRDPPANAAWNMAVDEALARERPEGEGTLRIYRWARPTLSFGRNQPARPAYDPAAITGRGAQAVRRPTGGREVLHDRELTYALVLPLRGSGGLRHTYRMVNDALLDALRSLGVEARLVPERGRMPGLGEGACFEAPAPDEIEAQGGKLVGSAQARIEGTLLQHGSLLLGPPSVALGALTVAGPEGSEPGQGGVDLAALTGAPVSFPRVAAAVEAALAGALGGSWTRSEMRAGERRRAASLHGHYASPAWTWRR